MTALIILGITLEILIATFAIVTRHYDAELKTAFYLLAVLVAAFLPYFAAVRQAVSLDWRRIRWIVMVVALAARATMLFTPLLLSDDAYRYLWEGRIQSLGFNPYHLAPDAPELVKLWDDNWELVAHRDVPSAYPPLSLLAFRAGARVCNRAEVFKWIFTAFDLATLWVILQLLRSRGLNPGLALIWAWNPLVILEFAGSAHEMSMAICFFLLGLLMLDSGRQDDSESGQTKGSWRTLGASVCFSAAVLSHLLALPAVLAVVLAKRLKDIRYWILFAIVIVVPCTLFADAGWKAFRGVTQFAGHWRFNGSLFELLVNPFGTQPSPEATTMTAAPPVGKTISYLRPKLICASVLVAVCAWTYRARLRPTRAAFVVMSAVLLLSPTVHPWYVTWMVALACLEFSPAWIAFSGLVCLSYVAKLTQLGTGMWVDSVAVRYLEYVPLFLLLTLECCSARFASAARSLSQKRHS